MKKQLSNTDSPWDATLDEITRQIKLGVGGSIIRERIKKALQGAYARGYAKGRDSGRLELRDEIRGLLG